MAVINDGQAANFAAAAAVRHGTMLLSVAKEARLRRILSYGGENTQSRSR